LRQPSIAQLDFLTSQKRSITRETHFENSLRPGRFVSTQIRQANVETLDNIINVKTRKRHGASRPVTHRRACADEKGGSTRGTPADFCCARRRVDPTGLVPVVKRFDN
jgi:hypothetical protein